MKIKTNKMKATIGLFAVLTVTVVFSIAAAPAMAAPGRLESSAVRDLLQQPDGLDHLSDMLDIAETLRPDEGPFPDGGDWEPVFPDGGGEEAVPAEDEAEDEAVDEAVDEVCEEEPAEDVGDEAVEEVVEEQPVEDVGDEAVEEQPVDEGTPDTTIEEASDEADELPYTGGSSIPWLIGGAGVILAGAILLLCRGHRTESR